WQGRLEEGERWLDHAERVIRAGAEPMARMMVHIARGSLESARGRDGDALVAFHAAGRQAESVVTPHTLATQARVFILRTLLRMGEMEAVDQALAEMDERERGIGDTRPVVAEPQTAQHGALVSEILTLLAGRKPASAHGAEDRLREPLSESESRILRYLPTNLSVPEIATEVYLSANTVKTHMRHLYAKLGAHRRGQAVQQARALGLLAPTGVRIASRSG